MLTHSPPPLTLLIHANRQAHLQCLFKIAVDATAKAPDSDVAKTKSWYVCITCKQSFSGNLQLLMAKEIYDRITASGDGSDLAGARMSACVNYATALSQNREHAAAEKILRLTIKIAQAVGKPNAAHRMAIAQMMGNLAITVYYQSRPAESIPIYRKTLELMERCNDKSHFDTARTRMNLANALTDTGKLDDAIQLARDALETNKKNVGASHPMVIMAQANLGHMLVKAGKAEDAVPLLRESLTLCRRVLGPAHSEIPRTARSLATALAEVGDVAGSRAVATEHGIRTNDNDHAVSPPLNIAGASDVGEMTAEIAAEIVRLHTEGMGKKKIGRTLDGATSKMINAVLAAATAVPPAAAAATAATSTRVDSEMLLRKANINLDKATLLCDNGKFADGARLNQQTYATVCKELGADHLMAHKIATNIGCDLLIAKKYEESLRITDEALAGFQRLVGADSPLTKSCRGQLEMTKALAVPLIKDHIQKIIATGPLDEVLVAAIEKDVATLKRLVGPVHAASLGAARQLALQCLGVEQIKAWDICQDLLKLTTLQFGADHPETTATLALVDAVVERLLSRSGLPSKNLLPGHTDESVAAGWASLKNVPAETIEQRDGAGGERGGCRSQ